MVVVAILLNKFGKNDKKADVKNNDEVEELAIENHFPDAKLNVGVLLLKKIGITGRQGKREKEKKSEKEHEHVCHLCSKGFKNDNQKPKTVEGSKKLYHSLCLKRWVNKKKQCPETLERIKGILAASIQKLTMLKISEKQKISGPENLKLYAIGSKTSLYEGASPAVKDYNFTPVNSNSNGVTTVKLNSSPRNTLLSPSKVSLEQSKGSPGMDRKDFKISPKSTVKMNGRSSAVGQIDEEDNIDEHFRARNNNVQSKRDRFRKRKPKTQLGRSSRKKTQMRNMRDRGMTFAFMDSNQEKASNLNDEIIASSGLRFGNNNSEYDQGMQNIRSKKRGKTLKIGRMRQGFSSPQYTKKKEFDNREFKFNMRKMIKDNKKGQKYFGDDLNFDDIGFGAERRKSSEDISIDEASLD